MKALVWLLKITEGWKTVLGYLALQLFGSYPLLLGSVKNVAEDYKNPASWLEFAGQLLLAWGVAWRTGKNFIPALEFKKD